MKSIYYVSCVGELCVTIQLANGNPPELYKITGVNEKCHLIGYAIK